MLCSDKNGSDFSLNPLWIRPTLEAIAYQLLLQPWVQHWAQPTSWLLWTRLLMRVAMTQRWRSWNPWKAATLRWICTHSHQVILKGLLNNQSRRNCSTWSRKYHNSPITYHPLTVSPCLHLLLVMSRLELSPAHCVSIYCL